jgi:hypothetical protein
MTCGSSAPIYLIVPNIERSRSVSDGLVNRRKRNRVSARQARTREALSLPSCSEGVLARLG